MLSQTRSGFKKKLTRFQKQSWQDFETKLARFQKKLTRFQNQRVASKPHGIPQWIGGAHHQVGGGAKISKLLSKTEKTICCQWNSDKEEVKAAPCQTCQPRIVTDVTGEYLLTESKAEVLSHYNRMNILLIAKFWRNVDTRTIDFSMDVLPNFLSKRMNVCSEKVIFTRKLSKVFSTSHSYWGRILRNSDAGESCCEQRFFLSNLP